MQTSGDPEHPLAAKYIVLSAWLVDWILFNVWIVAIPVTTILLKYPLFQMCVVSPRLAEYEVNGIKCPSTDKESVPLKDKDNPLG